MITAQPLAGIGDGDAQAGPDLRQPQRRQA